MKRKFLASFVLSLACLFLSACSPSDPLKKTVHAGSQVDFDMWRGDVGYDLTPKQWKNFDEAVQELKLAIQIDHTASGGASVDATMLQEIDGKTVGAVIRMGLEHELKRVTSVLDEAEDHVRENSRLRTEPGDQASADRLAEIRAQQARMLAQAKADYARVVSLLKTYEGPNWAPPARH